MNKMLGYLKDYKRESVLAPLFKMLEATFDLFVPLVMADIVNIGIAAHGFHYILVRCGILLLLAMIGLACSLTAQYFSAKAAVGYSTALRAAELGMKVALVERDATVGGTCLNRGCIPSKALITATHTIDTVHRAAELGVNASVNGIDFGTLRDYRLRVVKTMVGGLAGLLAHRGITVFRANAAFHADETAPATSNHIVHLVPSPDQSDILTYHKADVPEPSGPTMDLTATNIVIATGAKPRPLPGNPFAGALIDSTQALEVNEFPSSAVIIGAGAIALEFASMWNAAGSKVTLLIRKDRVLSAWDRRAGTTLTRELKRHGVNIITRASVTHVDTGANLGATVHYTREGQDGEQSVWGEIALVAIGRDPITDPAWGVTIDDHGHVATDAYGRTDKPGVWAVGDVTAGHALAHRAFEQGIVIAETIAGGRSHRAANRVLLPRSGVGRAHRRTGAGERGSH
mgnify:CR=1 FL=1